MLKHNDPTRKPLIFYIAIAMTFISAERLCVSSPLTRQTQGTDYSEFLKRVDDN